MRSASLLIQFAGAVQIAIALANAALPKQLDYPRNLGRLDTIVRQVFIVHSLYIVLVLLGMGLLCILFPVELAGGDPLPTFLAAGMSLFWLARLPVQLWYYDPAFMRSRPLVHISLLLASTYLAVLFALVALAPGHLRRLLP